MATCLVMFEDGQYAVIDKERIFLDDPDSQISEEKKYQIYWGKETKSVTVKMIGDRAKTEAQLEKICNYTLKHAGRKSKNTKKPEKIVNSTPNTMSMAKAKLMLEKFSDDESIDSSGDSYKPTQTSESSELNDESSSESSDRDDMDEVSKKMKHKPKSSFNKKSSFKKKSSFIKPNVDNNNNNNSDELEAVLKKLNERDEYIKELKNQIKDAQDKTREQNRELEMFRVLKDGQFVNQVREVGLSIVKYLCTDVQREEIRRIGNRSDQILIHPNYNEFMPVELHNYVKIMIRTNKNSTAILRCLLTTLINDRSIWAKSSGREMLSEHESVIRACIDYLSSNGRTIQESSVKTVLRGLCSESKKQKNHQKKSPKKKDPKNKDQPGSSDISSNIS